MTRSIQVFPVAALLSLIVSTLMHGVPWLQAYLQDRKPGMPSVDLSFVAVEAGLLSVFFSVALSAAAVLPMTSSVTAVAGGFMACIVVSYRFTIVPILRSVRYDLQSPPASLRRWLNTHGAEDIDVFLYGGPRKNALAIGVLPATRTILINASLADEMYDEHLVAILAHELGHLRRNHLSIAFPVNLVCAALAGAGVAFVASLSLSPEVLKVVFIAGAGGLLGSVFIGLIPGLLMRHFEYAADAFAAEIVGVETMKSALKRLDEVLEGAITEGNLTHPPLDRRQSHLETLPIERSHTESHERR